MSPPRRRLPAALALLLLLPLRALAFTLEPISQVFTPAGPGAVQTYAVRNPGAEAVAISISVHTRAVDVEGVEHNQSAEDDFLVYPPQFIVPPGGQQTVRVSWLGTPSPEGELAFRLVVDQLPIEALEAGARASGRPVGSVRLLHTYRGSIYIRPAKARPALAVERAALEKDAQGRPALAVLLSNAGSARAPLLEQQLQVRARKGGQSVVLPAARNEGTLSLVVMAGGKRRLRLPWPEGLPVGEVDVSVVAAP
jgi:fimbrial chaperone protein